MDSLSKTDVKIAKYIIENGENLKNMTSSDLAKEIVVGQSTVIKFIKKNDSIDEFSLKNSGQGYYAPEKSTILMQHAFTPIFLYFIM